MLSGKGRLFFAVSCLLLASAVVHAEPEPEPEAALKGRRSSYFNAPANPKFRNVLPEEHFIPELRQANVGVDEEEEDIDVADNSNGDGTVGNQKGEASSGRLFMKKFLLFRNMFGNNQQQPVIPIIITGANNAATTNPTTTITETGSIPTASGTITTSPATRNREIEEEGDGEAEAAEEFAAMNEQALQAALVAGAQEYVVTDEEIKGTSDGKATKAPNRINLKRKGSRKGQVVSVRIPPKYRRYFKNGQKVMLNTSGGGGKRRVIRKRVNNVRRRNNKNNRRIMAA